MHNKYASSDHTIKLVTNFPGKCWQNALSKEQIDLFKEMSQSDTKKPNDQEAPLIANDKNAEKAKKAEENQAREQKNAEEKQAAAYAKKAEANQALGQKNADAKKAAEKQAQEMRSLFYGTASGNTQDRLAQSEKDKAIYAAKCNDKATKPGNHTNAKPGSKSAKNPQPLTKAQEAAKKFEEKRFQENAKSHLQDEKNAEGNSTKAAKAKKDAAAAADAGKRDADKNRARLDALAKAVKMWKKNGKRIAACSMKALHPEYEFLCRNQEARECSLEALQNKCLDKQPFNKLRHLKIVSYASGVKETVYETTVGEDATIADVRNQVSTHLGLSMKICLGDDIQPDRLCQGNRELEDTDLVADCRHMKQTTELIVSQQVLELKLDQVSHQLPLRTSIKNITPTTLFHLTDANEKLMASLSKMASCYRFTWRGKPVGNNENLYERGVRAGDTLHMTLRLPGGAPQDIATTTKTLQDACWFFNNMLLNGNLPDSMRAGWIEQQRISVDELHDLYEKNGIDAQTLEERPNAEVNPTYYYDPVDAMDVVDDAGSSTDVGIGDDSPANNNDESETLQVWKEALRHPGKDPRIKKPAGQWIEDAHLETMIRESDLNPNGKGNPYTLTPEDKARCMGARKIDHSLSHLSDEKYNTVIREIGLQFFYGPKQPEVIRPNSDGSMTRVLSTLLDSMPCSDAMVTAVVVMMGRAQGGKSYEGVLDCWAKYFVHAVLPVYYVRCMGGLNDVNEVCKDFENFNSDIRSFLKRRRMQLPTKFEWLTNDEIDKFMLQPRLMSNNKSNDRSTNKRGFGVEVEFADLDAISNEWASAMANEDNLNNVNRKHQAVRLTRPQVCVGLANGSTVQKFMNSGCVLPPQTAFNLGDYTVRAADALAVFKPSKSGSAKITPLSLMCGAREIKHTFPSGKSGSAIHGPHPGEHILHSAYGPACWDTSAAYNEGTNAKRCRISRLVDEVDTTTSEKTNHVVANLTNSSSKVSGAVRNAMDKGAHDKWKQARSDLHQTNDELEGLESQRDLKMQELETLQRGEDYQPSAEHAREIAVSKRNARAERRSRGMAAGSSTQAFDPNAESDYSDGDDSDDDSVYSAFSDGSDDTSTSDKARRQARREERRQKNIDRLEAEISDMSAKIDGCIDTRDGFEAAEAQAVKQAGRHITGMAAVAMYNVGLTATIFGCMQRTRGGKIQTRLMKMPTPDAYNDLVRWDEHLSEYRKLINPALPSKLGDIKIIEADVNSIQYLDLGKPKNKNAWFEQWMLAQPEPKATEGENGVVYPVEPLSEAVVRGKNRIRSYTIKPEWYEHDPSKGEQPKHPWVSEMMNLYLMTKKLGKYRMHNSWDRNGSMFTRALAELQRQRPLLKKVRRGAQGLIITNETRYTKMKDHLIADTFVRCGHQEGEPMHDTCFYNYSGERLTLNWRDDSNLSMQKLLKGIIEDPYQYLRPLREYLSGDKTMHYSWTNPVSRLKERKLDNDWLMKHYILPIRNELSRCVERLKVTDQQLNRYSEDVAIAKAQGRDHDLIEKPVGEINFKEEQHVCTNATTGLEIGRVSLSRLDFSHPTPQPRFMATLFTLVDAHRFKEDPDNMLPTPYIGMTKTAGGRAQRYLCHGHRSRIQVMTHATDIFPHKQLGLAMCDAIQEAFRPAGFDEVERWGTEAEREASGCAGEWMEDWVPQVYVSTRDFVPLLQNALMTQEEWWRLLNKERRDPRRDSEPLPQNPGDVDLYLTRMNETPTDTFERVIGGEVTASFEETMRILVEGGRAATRGDMPATDYPNMHMWLLAHVNRAPATKARFLRQSNQDKNENGIRDNVLKMCRGYLEAEIQTTGFTREVYEAKVEALDEQFDRDMGCTLEEFHERNKLLVKAALISKIPLPMFSPAHAPGGCLEARDRAENDAFHVYLRDLLAGRATIEESYTDRFGPGLAYVHDTQRKDEKEKALLKAARRMREENIDPDDGPAHLFGYTRKLIKDYMKQHAATRKGRSRKSGWMWDVVKGEETDKAKLNHLSVEIGRVFDDEGIITRVGNSSGDPQRDMQEKQCNQSTLMRHKQRLQQIFDSNNPYGQQYVTLVDQLPSCEKEFDAFIECYTKAVEDTGLQGDAGSVGGALKWAMIALRHNNNALEGDESWNLKRCVNAFESEAIKAAKEKVNANADALARIALRETDKRDGSIYWFMEHGQPSSGNKFFVPSDDGPRTRKRMPQNTTLVVAEDNSAALSLGDGRRTRRRLLSSMQSAAGSSADID
jgi:hypothetical protein